MNSSKRGRADSAKSIRSAEVHGRRHQEPGAALDLLKFDHYLYIGVQVLARLPVSLRVLRHHCALRTQPTHQSRADAGRAGGALRPRIPRRRRFRRRQLHRQQEGGEGVLCRTSSWQKAHGYPFEFSTEASINLADDQALLALMRAANFFAIFVGIESPDADTLVSMQKKQNTRRVLARISTSIYRAGIFVRPALSSASTASRARWPRR